MKSIIKNGILTIIIFSMKFYIYFCQNDFLNLFSSPKLIKNSLCSFNDIAKLTMTDIKCECYYGFVRDNNIRKINNYDVDCSYQLKSRLITLTFSLIIPFGFDYLYLGYNIVFFFIFFITLGIIILNLFLLNCVLKYDRITSLGNIDKNFEKKYVKFKYIVIIIDPLNLYLNL